MNNILFSIKEDSRREVIMNYVPDQDSYSIRLTKHFIGDYFAYELINKERLTYFQQFEAVKIYQSKG